MDTLSSILSPFSLSLLSLSSLSILSPFSLLFPSVFLGVEASPVTLYGLEASGLDRSVREDRRDGG